MDEKVVLALDDQCGSEPSDSSYRFQATSDGSTLIAVLNVRHMAVITANDEIILN